MSVKCVHRETEHLTEEGYQSKHWYMLHSIMRSHLLIFIVTSDTQQSTKTDLSPTVPDSRCQFSIR